MDLSVAVFQIGARRHFAVPRGFASVGALQRLETDAANCLMPWCWVKHVPGIGRVSAIRSVLIRTVPDIPPSCIHGHFGFVIGNLVRNRLASSSLWPADRWMQQNQAFGKIVCRQRWGNATTVYAYNGAALEIFQKAKREGRQCILDQTAAPWRWNTELLKASQSSWPDWEARPGDLDFSGAMTDREESEWVLSDRIICGSQFVVDCIREIGGPCEKCVVVPYPSPTVSGQETHAGRCSADEAEKRRKRILFVGTLQLRKGIPYLWEALQLLPAEEFECRIIGPVNITDSAMALLKQQADCRGAVSRQQVAEHYAWADVFVLPTLSEGSANVCHEALATGLPIVTTQAAGISVGADQITLVPTADSKALAEGLRTAATRPHVVKGAEEKLRSIHDYGVDLLRAIGGP